MIFFAMYFAMGSSIRISLLSCASSLESPTCLARPSDASYLGASAVDQRVHAELADVCEQVPQKSLDLRESALEKRPINTKETVRASSSSAQLLATGSRCQT